MRAKAIVDGKWKTRERQKKEVTGNTFIGGFFFCCKL